MDVLPLTVDLVDQREVKVEALHTFSVEHSDFGLVLLILHVLDHIREPHSQPVIADTQKHIKHKRIKLKSAKENVYFCL